MTVTKIILIIYIYIYIYLFNFIYYIYIYIYIYVVLKCFKNLSNGGDFIIIYFRDALTKTMSPL